MIVNHWRLQKQYESECWATMPRIMCWLLSGGKFFNDSTNRGLGGRDMVLVAMDGLQSLEKIFKKEFPEAKVQRCQIHISQNVLVKVHKKHKKSRGG